MTHFREGRLGWPLLFDLRSPSSGGGLKRQAHKEPTVSTRGMRKGALMESSWVLWSMTAFAVVVLYEMTRGGALLLNNLREEPKIGAASDHDWPDPPPDITVIMPAKDEEDYIERSVRSVLASDYPHFDVIVMDDRSTDRTPEIIRDLAREDSRVTVASVDRLPEGWTGKTHALYQAVKSTSSSILLFIDADTVVSPDTISRSLGFFLDRDLGMLSLVPGFMERGFIENAIHPHLALGMAFFYPLTDVNDQNKKTAFATGQFLMITRKAYEEVGTWKSFRNEITEDIALSRAVKDVGQRLMVLRAKGLALTKRFGTIAELLGFWKRTYYGGFNKSPAKMIHLTANFVSLSLLSVFMIYSAALWAMGKGDLPSAILFFVSFLAMLALVIPFGIYLQEECGNWAYSLTSPVALPVCAWVVINTLVTVLRDKGIRWRGSTYK